MRWREKFNELVPEGGEKVTFEDIKPRMSIFGDPRTWEPEEEKQPDPVRTYNPEEHWRKLRDQGLLVEDEELGDER